MALRMRAPATAALLALVLAACGGSTDDAPTALPETLAVSAPQTRQALGTGIAFSSNTTDPALALTYLWDFGDGSKSTAANPTHAYTKPGLYTVRLTVTNEAGSMRTATATVAAADLDIVRGLACSGPDGSGWCWQRPLPQGNRILDYAFADDRLGWAVGEAGTVLATADGGVTWQARLSGTDSMLSQVVFAGPRAGWVAGSNGELLRTADGGATWQRVSLGRSETARTLGASDADTAWVTTDYGTTAYVTRDGGSQWKRIVGPGGSSRLLMVGASDVWAYRDYHYFDQTVSLMHSVDAGTTWSEVRIPPSTPGLYRSIDDLQFSDARHGLLVASESGFDSATSRYVSRRLAWRTADGGASWQAVASPWPAPFGVAWRLVGTDTLFTHLPYSDQPLQRSTDGGATWQALAPLPRTVGYGVTYEPHSAMRVSARDGAGRFWLTTDGGANWTEHGAGGTASAQVTGIWFFDAREGLALGSDGSSMRTSDGGRTWHTTTPQRSGYGYGWRRAQFAPDGGTGWVISDGGSVLRSTDRGRTWLQPVPQSSTPLARVTDFHFVDELRGWAIAPYVYAYPEPAQSVLYRSSDGGMSWQAVADAKLEPGFLAVRFADALHGVAVGPTGVAMVTSDGGASWSPRPTGTDRPLTRLAFAGADTVVAVGDVGTIARSTDRGRTWSRIAAPTTQDLGDVRFLSATTGYAVGRAGTLLVTRDGGVTWALQRTGTNLGLQAVHFFDEHTGWIAGDNGSILASATGGN